MIWFGKKIEKSAEENRVQNVAISFTYTQCVHTYTYIHALSISYLYLLVINSKIAGEMKEDIPEIVKIRTQAEN